MIAEPCSISPSSPTSAPLPYPSASAPRSSSARVRQERPERLAVLVDQRLEVLDVPAGERVRDDGARGGDARRWIDLPAAFLVDILDDRDDLAQTLHRPRIIALRGRDRRPPPGAARRHGREPRDAPPGRPGRLQRSPSRTRRSPPGVGSLKEERTVDLRNAARRARGRGRPPGRPGRLRHRVRRPRLPADARDLRRASGADRHAGDAGRVGQGDRLAAPARIAPRQWTAEEIEACRAAAARMGELL